MNLQRQFFRVMDKLISESSSSQLCFSAALGLFLGFSPIGTLHWAIFVLLAIVLRTNLLVIAITYMIFFPIDLLLDPVTHWIGMRLLTQTPSLQPYFAWLSHAPLLPYTEFNNTVVLGSFLIATLLSALLSIFLFFFGKPLLNRFLAAFKATAFWRKWVYSRIA